MIQTIRRREIFQALRQHGKTIGHFPLRMVFLPRSDLSFPSNPPNPPNHWPLVGREQHPTAAFAVPRRLGTAVERNRFKRRMKEILREINSTTPIAEGMYLFKPQKDAIDMPYRDLKEVVIKLVFKAKPANRLKHANQRQTGEQENQAIKA